MGAGKGYGWRPQLQRANTGGKPGPGPKKGEMTKSRIDTDVSSFQPTLAAVHCRKHAPFTRAKKVRLMVAQFGQSRRRCSCAFLVWT